MNTNENKVLVWGAHGIYDVYNIGYVDAAVELRQLVLETVEESYDGLSLEVLKECATLNEVISWVYNNTDGDDNFEVFQVTYRKDIS